MRARARGAPPTGEGPARVHRRPTAFAIGALATLVAAAGCTDSTQPSFVASVRLDPDFAGVAVGETTVLEAVPVGEDGEALRDRAGRVEFRVGNPGVATLEPLGDGRVRVTGVSLGETIVEATLGRGGGIANMFVQPPGLDRVRVEPSSVSLTFPGGASVRAILLDASGRELSHQGFIIEWESSNPSVVTTLYTRGSFASLRPQGRGSATVTAKVGSKRASVSVTVQ